MEKIIAKGTNWIKGLALLGMMVALVGVFAYAPAASATSASSVNSPIICPSSAVGKISVRAIDSLKGDVSDATVTVFNKNGVLVLKGTTDANGNFLGYICAGTYKVRVFANGYKEFTEYATISGNETSYVKAVLEPASPRLSR